MRGLDMAASELERLTAAVTIVATVATGSIDPLAAIARRRVYLSNATIHGRFALRACFVDHRTTEDDVRVIVSEVVQAAGEVDATM